MKNSQQPELINGGRFSDDRGTLQFVNDFDLSCTKRFYTITQAKSAGARAWQGHKLETKFFFCLTGSFHVFLVKPDDWETPSAHLPAEHFLLSETESRVLVIPPGFANGIISATNQSSLLVFSDKTVEESAEDIFRFPKNLWINWDDYV